MQTEETRPKTGDEAADFVMSFVEHSTTESRRDMEPIWDEVEQNFLVQPYNAAAISTDTSAPLGDRHDLAHKNRGFAVMKDPESHQVMMTIASGIVGATIPEPGYAKAKRVGFEDIPRAKVVNELVEHSDRLEGAFTTNLEWVMQACIYGTGIKEIYWDYIEQPQEFRRLGFEPDPFTGEMVPVDEVERLTAPVYDDVREEVFDVRDFFPDPGNNRISKMLGAVRRFKVSAATMKERAEAGIYKKSAVEEAAQKRQQTDAKEHEDKFTGEESDINTIRESHPDFMIETAYRYIGTVPWDSPDGYQRREIVVAGGVVVRDEPWFRRLPWFDIKITPRLNSFWGISPGELIRFDQDFADVVKMMLADAVVRLVHPPHVYNKNSDVDLAKLRAWRPGVPIGVQGDPNHAIGEVKYNPQLQPAFMMQGGVKQQMREGSAASDANQGFGIGTKRLSASEAVGTFENAAKRPDMFAQVVEREYLPPCAKYKVKLYGEYLEDDEDLADRVGESNMVTGLADILHDYDIQYVGSRMVASKQQQLGVMREMMGALANPMLAPLLPIIPLFQKFFDQNGLHELAAMVGNPQMVEGYLALHGVVGQQGQNPQNGNGNGTTPSSPSPMTLPAQALGGVQ